MNELSKSNSSYLYCHKDNPIHWKMWNSNSINFAKIYNKPIFLSIGYFTCHWCHVMAREVFQDEEVAKILNENFICIKVDREEHPDVDSFYINALGLLQNGNAGWPANLFLTPDLKPFFGFTYLPKRNFIKIVNEISRVWNEDKTELVEYAEKIYQYLTTNYLSSLRNYPYQFLDINNLEKFLYDIDQKIRSKLDLNGGFSFRPKFPPHQLLEYMLLRLEDTPSKYILESVDKTLTNMILGGMYDVVDYGFCRYSVDENWMVPHFEKMLYDNSFLIYIYSKASKVFENIDLNKSKIFRYIAVNTFDFLNRFLLYGDTYLSSLSAESECDGRDEEGAYYLFQREEIENVEYFSDFFGLHDFFNPHTKYGGLIVHYKEFPSYQNLEKMEYVVQSLRKIRNKKSKPYPDNKVILSWNCILCTYLLKSYEITQYRPFFIYASNIINFILNKMFDFNESKFYRIAVCNNFYGDPTLEDYVWLGLSLVYYSKLSGKSEYTILARKIFEKCKELFYRDGVFYNSDQFLSYDIFDNSIHSNNSLALLLDLSLNETIGKDVEDLVLKFFNFSENFLYMGSFFTFLEFYKLRVGGVSCRVEKIENIYRIFWDSNFDVEPSFVEVEKGNFWDLNLKVCDEHKCFELHKRIDL
ncbi:MAG: DUF255 domain-containing protein [Candidatus Calescibacterium sp.]|nr:DUF255 domain-containing protein [Candidatus Calescibacterium sp.]